MSLDIKKMKANANQIRKDIVEMVHLAGSGHPGGSLSATDILTVLYYDKMNIDPKNPEWEDRDRFVLSKGHAAPVLYATLANKGYFDKEELKNLRKIDHILQGHPNMTYIPGVDMSTGSLGQGFSTSVGMALSAKIDNKSYKTYALLGDGEINEGIIWEAAMSAAHYKLDNLCAILDYNGLQIDGKNEDVMGISPVDKKFEAFNWNVIKINGHDFEEIHAALNKADEVKDRPTIIIADTVKGKGVSFMEDQAAWHGTAPNAEDLQKALEELGGQNE